MTEVIEDVQKNPAMVEIAKQKYAESEAKRAALEAQIEQEDEPIEHATANVIPMKPTEHASTLPDFQD